jgi:hypothetical protein
MTPKISALVSDVDGTSVTDDKILTSRAQAAVASSPDLQIFGSDDYAAAIEANRSLAMRPSS